MFGPDALADLAIIKDQCQRQFPSILADRPEEPVITVIDQAVFDPFEKQPFFYSGARWAHLRSNDHSPSTLEVITWSGIFAGFLTA
jgi:hypothetical protein